MDSNALLATADTSSSQKSMECEVDDARKSVTNNGAGCVLFPIVPNSSLEGLKLPVEADGEWWDANVVEEKDGKVHVHYVGGTDDQDEWISLDSGRIRPPAKPEFVWAVCADDKEHPCTIVEGSLSDTTGGKLCVFSFLEKKRFWVEHKAVSVFEIEAAKRRRSESSPGAMADAIDLAQDAMGKNLTLNQILATEDDPDAAAAAEEEAAAAAAAAAAKHAGKGPGRRPRRADFYHNGFGHARKRGASAVLSTEAENRRRKRRAAMRRLGLWPPPDPSMPPSP